MRTIEQLIEAAGGVAALPDLARDAGAKIDRTLPYKWLETGRIPEKHWDWLMPLAKATPAEMFKANRLPPASPEAAA